MPKNLTKHGLPLEERRLRAWDLKQQGWQQSKIAQEVSATPGAVSQWLKRARQEGHQARHRRKGSGPRPRLKEAQIQPLPTLLTPSPHAYGLSGTGCTRTNIVMLIRQVYGVQPRSYGAHSA